MAVFDPSIYDRERPTALSPGVTWTAKDPNITAVGNGGAAHLLHPRVGFAYDVKGTGGTVVRAASGSTVP